MGEIIQLDKYRANISVANNILTPLSEKDTYKIEGIRDSIEVVLEEISNDENMPLTVAMAAGRYAAMRLFQLQGRSETMAFMDQCIVTAELCDDLTRQLDEDA
jgi:uncharacterized protein (UPF0147 family)